MNPKKLVPEGSPREIPDEFDTLPSKEREIRVGEMLEFVKTLSSEDLYRHYLVCRATRLSLG